MHFAWLATAAITAILNLLKINKPKVVLCFFAKWCSTFGETASGKFK
jgi:hypothetical protein